jgi:hypothetical protein
MKIRLKAGGLIFLAFNASFQENNKIFFVYPPLLTACSLFFYKFNIGCTTGTQDESLDSLSFIPDKLDVIPSRRKFIAVHGF